MLRLKFRKDIEKLPVFQDVEKIPDGICASGSKAFPYHKYRSHFIRLGRITGFEAPLKLYQIRRASGRNINYKYKEVLRPSSCYKHSY